MRSFYPVLLLFCTVVTTSIQHGFLENSSRYLGGLNFQRLPPVLIFALENSNISIACSATQNNVKVSWIKENDPKNTQFKVLETGSLYINQVKTSDGGSFRCLLTNNNEDTIASHSVSIKVANSNNFWESASFVNITTVENSVIRLPCPVRKYDAPPPYGYDLSWTKSNKEVGLNNRKMLLQNGVLIIKSAHQSDSGIYRCKATFDYDSIESPGYFVKISADYGANFIKEPEENNVILPPSPHLLILNTPMVVNAVEGYAAVLECITNDLSLEPYQWERQGKAPMHKDVEIIGGSFLYLRYVTVKDSGVYKCKSKNAEHQQLRLVRLVVLLPPEVIFSRPESVNSGPHVRFNCTASGRPQPSIEILKDGLPLHNDFNYDIKGPISIPSNTVTYGLHISYVWRKDEGTYQCLARSKAGIASEVMTLEVEHVNTVSPPGNVYVVNFTSSSIYYQWTETKSNSLLVQFKGFIIYFFPADRRENVTELVLNGSKLYKEYTDLLPDKNYTFIIRVLQIHGDNTNISEPVHVYQKTKAERPIHGPDVYFSLHKNSIQVRWVPLSYKDAGGKITKQKIQWKKEGDVYGEKFVDPSTTEFIITDRDPSKIYLVRVLVSTSAGFPLQHQNWIEIGTKERPKPITKEWSNPMNIGLCLQSNKFSNILISWNYISELENENYNIEIFGTNSETKIFTIQAFKQRLLVEQLEGGCYTVHLTGDSEYSQFVEAESLICTKVPEKEVTSVQYRLYSSKVTDFTSDMISISWEANIYKYFIIEMRSVKFLLQPYEQTDYDTPENSIFFTNDKAAYQIFDTFILIVTCKSANLTLLSPATTYRIQVIAANEHHKGIPSSPLFVTTHEGVPSTPLKYNVEVLTTSSVNVTWLPPIDMNGYLIRYEVSYSSDKAAWKTAITAPNTHSVVLNGLLSNTYYYVRIVASTRVGSGEVLEGVIFIPAELRQSLSPQMIAVCVISVFVFSTCLVLTYLCTKMFRMRKASSYGERDSNSSNTVNDQSSTERQKRQLEDHAMVESNSSSNSQQFSNNADVTRNEFKHYGVSGCKKHLPSVYKESSLTLLQNSDKSEQNSSK